jgi:predicted nucleic acid-binding protein
MLGAKSVVVADANVLLSAIAGRAAYRVLTSGLEIHTTEHTWGEVVEYIPEFQERYKRTIEEMAEALAKTPVHIHTRGDYEDKLEEATALIAHIDPEDVDVAALALKLRSPLWSHDDIFKNFPLERYTTAQLIKILGV